MAWKKEGGQALTRLRQGVFFSESLPKEEHLQWFINECRCIHHLFCCHARPGQARTSSSVGLCFLAWLVFLVSFWHLRGWYRLIGRLIWQLCSAEAEVNGEVNGERRWRGEAGWGREVEVGYTGQRGDDLNGAVEACGWMDIGGCETWALELPYAILRVEGRGWGIIGVWACVVWLWLGFVWWMEGGEGGS